LNKAKFGFLRRSVVLVGRETSQAITAALGSTDCVGISGDLLPPSPPAEKASASEERAAEVSGSDGRFVPLHD
jgi:hypothetical protein